MSKSSESGEPSFWSLPNDVALNILARIPRIYHPFLSRVCKSFRSLISSPEFGGTRALIGKSEDCIYLCLQHPCENPKPRWYTLAPAAPTQKLIPMPIPSFPDDHPQQPALVSIASEIYVIGGFVKGHRSSKVFILDCRRHQWRTLPDMRIPRGNPTAGLIDGKIHVFGGCSKSCNSFVEIYDPETQSWEPSDLRSVATTTDSETLGKVLFQMRVDSGEPGVRRRMRLHWCDLEEPELKWNEVKGFEGPGFISIPNLAGGGRRFKVWWVSFERIQDSLVRNFEILCGEVSFERRQELYGTVECSKLLYTLDRFESGGLGFPFVFCHSDALNFVFKFLCLHHSFTSPYPILMGRLIFQLLLGPTTLQCYLTWQLICYSVLHNFSFFQELEKGKPHRTFWKQQGP